jgi:DNA end-binding protein Ku
MNVVDLMAALKRSIEKPGAANDALPKKAPAKKAATKAPARKVAAKAPAKRRASAR